MINDIFTELNNWFIIKLLGGFTLITIVLLKVFSNIFVRSINQASQNFFDKNLQRLKGEIDKNNSILNSLTQNHLLTSQKIIDKKINSYDILWNAILEIKNSFPAGIHMVHKYLHDDEFTNETTILKLQKNEIISSSIYSLNLDKEMTKIASLSSNIYQVRPYISDEALKYFNSYHVIIGRICYKFLDEWRVNKLYNWKKDRAALDLLSVALNSRELNFILEQKLFSLETLFEILEFKIINDMKLNLHMKSTVPDTIDHLKEIEKLLNKEEVL